MKPPSLVITLTLIALTLTALSAGAPRFSEWSEPVNMGSPPNSPLPDFPGSISKDGLSLYIQRGVTVGEDLWVAHRDTDAPWGVPQRLPDTVNSNYNDRAARISPDGHWLFFASDRPGGLGGFDIWASWRRNIHDDFGWQAAINLDGEINSSDFDSGPTIFRDDDTGSVEIYFTSGRPGGLGATDIYVSKSHTPGRFGSPELVPELSGPFRDEGPYIRRDGLEIFVQSNRDDAGPFDLWVSRRDSTEDPWSNPEKVTSVNGPDTQEVTPVISWDRRMLFFGSLRPGSAAADIYVAVRTKEGGH